MGIVTPPTGKTRESGIEPSKTPSLHRTRMSERENYRINRSLRKAFADPEGNIQENTMGPRPFFDTARDIRRGQFLEDCADELQKCIVAVEETGKPSKLVIELSIKPASKGQGAVCLADKIVAKLPQLPAGETIMFVTPENNLALNDPRQKEMDLKAVTAEPTATLKTVNR